MTLTLLAASADGGRCSHVVSSRFRADGAGRQTGRRTGDRGYNVLRRTSERGQEGTKLAGRRLCIHIAGCTCACVRTRRARARTYNARFRSRCDRTSKKKNVENVEGIGWKKKTCLRLRREVSGAESKRILLFLIRHDDE